VLWVISDVESEDAPAGPIRGLDHRFPGPVRDGACRRRGHRGLPAVARGGRAQACGRGQGWLRRLPERGSERPARAERQPHPLGPLYRRQPVQTRWPRISGRKLECVKLGCRSGLLVRRSIETIAEEAPRVDATAELAHGPSVARCRLPVDLEAESKPTQLRPDVAKLPSAPAGRGDEAQHRRLPFRRSAHENQDHSARFVSIPSLDNQHATLATEFTLRHARHRIGPPSHLGG
jgi:hypothetical protein